MSDYPRIHPLPDGLVHLTTMGFASIGGMSIVGGGGGNATWPLANKAIYVPFRIAAPYTFNTFLAVVGISSNNLDMGVYSADGTKIISTGSTPAGANIKTVSVASTTLSPGLYYLAMACDNTTIAFQSYTLTATAKAALWAAMGVSEQASAFPLPATATFASNTLASVPLFGITNRSVV